MGVRKPWDRLSDDQQVALLRLFQYAPVLSEVNVQRELLTGLFDRRSSKVQANADLQQWIERIQALGLVCFDAFLATLSRWQDKITNYLLGVNPVVLSRDLIIKSR